jgi:hypothetical protein
MNLISPTNKQITVRDDGSIEGDVENLAGWVRSGSHRDQDDYIRWFLFLKQWERQILRDKVTNDPEATWQDLVNAAVGKSGVVKKPERPLGNTVGWSAELTNAITAGLTNATTIKNIKEKEGILNIMKRLFF